MDRPRPLRTDRLRQMERPFGWVAFRILTSGLLGQLSTEAKLLYFVLCLVADRQGLSYWGHRRLQELLRLSPGELEGAQRELCDTDLVAFDGWLYQVLSLPAEPKLPLPPPETAGQRVDPATHRADPGPQQAKPTERRAIRLTDPRAVLCHSRVSVAMGAPRTLEPAADIVRRQVGGLPDAD